MQDIGVIENFFELGGDSLIATRLVAKIRSHFKTSDQVFSLTDFFANPTVFHIAAKIDGFFVTTKLESKRQELRALAVVDEGEF